MPKTLLTSCLAAVLLAATTSSLAQSGRTRLANICHVKGQQENVLRGIGLVVGLNGTGETNDLSTMRALSRALELMGNPVNQTGRFDQDAQQALRNVKNAALVMVTATVPATGARKGDKLDCSVSAINGKGLEGGRLIAASLQGPNTQSPIVYANCEGPLQVSDPNFPMVAHVHGGCQMVQDVKTPFVSEDGWVTIVLDTHHADFNVAEKVAADLATKYTQDYVPPGAQIDYDEVRRMYVKPVDAATIRVKVPERFVLDDDHVAFVSELLDTSIYDAEPEARVVCNTRTGSVVISGDVEIGDVVFTHQNLVIETGNSPGFLPIPPAGTNRPKLESLIEALANLRVPANDVIEIIRQIDRNGRLHAKLIVL